MGRFKQKRVAIIGDIMLDEYIWGTVGRISPEAPVPIVNVVRESRVPGGAGNVALNVAALGATPILFGIVGKDPAGQVLLEECQRRGVQTDGVLQDCRRTTTIKTRIVAHNQQVVRLDREQHQEITPALFESLIAAFERRRNETHAAIVSDYNKGVISSEMLRELSQRCQRASIPFFLDCKTRKFKSRLWVTCLTPNEHELEVMTRVPIHDRASLVRAAEKLFRMLDLQYLLVTRAERGIILFEKNGKAHEVPALAREVFDVTGAGDTVIACFTLAVASGAVIRDALILSSAAAAQVVSRIGTATVSTEEIAQVVGNTRLFARSASVPKEVRRAGFIQELQA